MQEILEQLLLDLDQSISSVSYNDNVMDNQDNSSMIINNIKTHVSGEGGEYQSFCSSLLFESQSPPNLLALVWLGIELSYLKNKCLPPLRVFV